MISMISRCVPYWRRRAYKQNATDAIYIVIFSYLIVFNILNTLYVDLDTPQETAQPVAYDIENVVFNQITCSFPISSQYQKTPRSVCYLLLIFTITTRNHGWLAAGAAASVLTYSGVAAIHLLILFATNNKFHLQQAKTRCELTPIPGSNTQFVACAGIRDHDDFIIMHIVTSVMFGALPMAAWSTTFRKSASKIILILWLLLLAVSHAFYPLTNTQINWRFQICPKHHVETLPKTNFQPSPLDDAWLASLSSLVSASQQASSLYDNGSLPACLYSCFATTAYLGRGSQNVVVSTFGEPDRNPFRWVNSGSKNRLSAIIFWWAYAFLALLTLFTTEKQSHLPKWIHKQVCSVEYRQYPWNSLWKCKNNNNHCSNTFNVDQDSGNDTTTPISLAAAKPRSLKQVQITILQLIQFVIQFSSVAAFGGNILFIEISGANPLNPLLEQEQFAAVGQWGCVAGIILVLFAAAVSRIWAADEMGGGIENVSIEGVQRLEKGGERRDADWMGVEDWDCRIGYAS